MFSLEHPGTGVIDGAVDGNIDKLGLSEGFGWKEEIRIIPCMKNEMIFNLQQQLAKDSMMEFLMVFLMVGLMVGLMAGLMVGLMARGIQYWLVAICFYNW